jgi:hypothetical protein
LTKPGPSHGRRAHGQRESITPVFGLEPLLFFCKFLSMPFRLRGRAPDFFTDFSVACKAGIGRWWDPNPKYPLPGGWGLPGTFSRLERRGAPSAQGDNGKGTAPAEAPPWYSITDLALPLGLSATVARCLVCATESRCRSQHRVESCQCDIKRLCLKLVVLPTSRSLGPCLLQARFGASPRSQP